MNPPTFICQQIDSIFDSCAGTTAGYFVFSNPHSYTCPLQTLKIFSMNYSLHSDCPTQHSTNSQYYKFNKICKSDFKTTDFRILPAQMSIHTRIRSLSPTEIEDWQEFDGFGLWDSVNTVRVFVWSKPAIYCRRSTRQGRIRFDRWNASEFSTRVSGIYINTPTKIRLQTLGKFLGQAVHETVLAMNVKSTI